MRWKLNVALFSACLFATTFAAIEPQGLSKNKHHEFRQYTCLQPEELEAAECRLAFMSADEEPTTITDNGCFIEKSDNQLVRNFCPLQCHDADFAYILAQRPEISKKACILDKSFGVVRRRKDWFLWRSLSCALTEVQFDMGCIRNTKNPINNNEEITEGSGTE
ncbi:hypothetical protein M3Y97_00723800 [Aphelenchoides bicaudatus]|nr:hypothetical protein M3Y97_00723800 [Aphelenchoides bicaudatus]